MYSYTACIFRSQSKASNVVATGARPASLKYPTSLARETRDQGTLRRTANLFAQHGALRSTEHMSNARQPSCCTSCAAKYQDETPGAGQRRAIGREDADASLVRAFADIRDLISRHTCALAVIGCRECVTRVELGPHAAASETGSDARDIASSNGVRELVAALDVKLRFVPRETVVGTLGAGPASSPCKPSEVGSAAARSHRRAARSKTSACLHRPCSRSRRPERHRAEASSNGRINHVARDASSTIMTDMTAFCLSSTFVPRALGASSERTRCLREWRTVPTRASSPRKLGVPNTPRPRMTAAAPQTNPAHADGDDTNIRIYGNNVTITESLRNYIQAKLAKVLRKYTSICQKVDVHLTVEHNPAVATKNSAEVVIFSGKTILRAEVRSKDSKYHQSCCTWIEALCLARGPNHTWCCESLFVRMLTTRFRRLHAVGLVLDRTILYCRFVTQRADWTYHVEQCTPRSIKLRRR